MSRGSRFRAARAPLYSSVRRPGFTWCCVLFVGILALAQRPVGGVCRRSWVGLLGGGCPPSSSKQAQHCTPSITGRLLTHRVSSRCSLQRGLGQPSRRVSLEGSARPRVCVFQAEAPGRPPWWTWWSRLLPLGGTLLGCWCARRLIHGAEPARGVGSSIRPRMPRRRGDTGGGGGRGGWGPRYTNIHTSK